jgi:hypothetical protein
MDLDGRDIYFSPCMLPAMQTDLISSTPFVAAHTQHHQHLVQNNDEERRTDNARDELQR